MSTSSDFNLHPITHVKLDGMGDIPASNWFNCTLPSLTLNAPQQAIWGENGTPLNVTTTAEGTWSPVTMTKIAEKDTDGELMKLAMKAKVKGPQEAKQDVTIAMCDKAGEPQQTWQLVGAWISSFQPTQQDAGGGSVATVNITITYDTAKLDGAGEEDV